MQTSFGMNEPSEAVIAEISKVLVSAIGEANKWNYQLCCSNLSDPKLSDGVQLAEHIRALQLAEVVIKRDLNRRIANARRHQNALQPVNKLPDEVLSVVFHQVAATVSIFNHFTSLSNIAGVSARWKSIVDSTPTLCIGHLRAVLEAPSSHLRKLDIKVAYPSSKRLNLLGGQRGVLEDVKLTNANIEWDSEAFTGLRTLELDYSGMGDSGVVPSVPQLLRLLEHSPGLRFLSFSGYLNGGSIPEDPLTLPHLTRLCLKDMSPDDATALMRSLRAPMCIHFILHCYSDTGHTPLLAQLESFLPSLRNSLQQAASISICLRPSSFHYHSVPTSPESPSKLDFELNGTRPYLALGWFCHQLHGYNVKTSPIHIRIDPRFDFTRSDTILPSLFHLHTVVSLKVADRVVGPCRLLEWLSRPNSIQGDQEQWPFPDLVEVEIGQSNLTFRDVRDFVRGRYLERPGEDQRGKPMRLKVLRTVGRSWPDAWAQPDIRRLLPETECSFQKSGWVRVPCKVNEEFADIEEEESDSEAHHSDESSIVDSETADETSVSESELAPASDEEMEEI
ncbi:hypothetical protein FRC05_003593 [Tulasnella sp. 425]|nr:hypothetical protein FRC05_003593 [Tulasnella sp. 425]